MSRNGLTNSVVFGLAPLVLGTLVKHYFERLIAQKIPTTTPDGVSQDGKQAGSPPNHNLRRDELLYDEAFALLKVSFARVRSLDPTATPPWPLVPAGCARCVVHLSFAVLCADSPMLRTIQSRHHLLVAFRISC